MLATAAATEKVSPHEGDGGESKEALGGATPSPHANDAPDAPHDCRICGSSDDVSTWLEPCECTGSMRFVHLHCLAQWIKHRGGGGDDDSDSDEDAEEEDEGKDHTCEVCHAKYTDEALGQVAIATLLPRASPLTGIACSVPPEVVEKVCSGEYDALNEDNEDDLERLQEIAQAAYVHCGKAAAFILLYTFPSHIHSVLQ